MSQKPPQRLRSEVRTETAGHLRTLYTVAAGLGLAFALERLFRFDVVPEDLLEQYAPLLVAFIATLIPFFHGAMRHMHDAWTHERNPSPGLMIFDFVAFFAQAAAFFAMAAFIRQPENFGQALVVLLLIDVVWLAARRFWSRERSASMSWLYINVVAVALLAAVLWAEPTKSNQTLQIWLITTIAVLRTVADYLLTKDFYFGVADSTEA